MIFCIIINTVCFKDLCHDHNYVYYVTTYVMTIAASRVYAYSYVATYMHT